MSTAGSQPAQAAAVPSRAEVLEVVRRTWGFDSLRPIQEEAIGAALRGRDSLTVMPTGGGKSLCYQVPPLVTGRLGVVVSPLIALMKDQVDGLRLAGVAAAAMHSGVDREELRETEEQLAQGELRLLFVAPERLLAPGFLARLVKAGPVSFAIDEAHCISQWGHDFRPEYRRLRELREIFPGASFHAFTATATGQVQHDIAAQLGLKDPAVLVGPFDRPNLTYRIIPRAKPDEQCAGIIGRHSRGEAAGATIIYCLSRRNTEDLAQSLRAHRIHAEAYHAGLGAKDRHRIQDDFANERLDVVVATVAFGMGIDRSNVRCVIHATMPKSIEHYQQETGRAGRDGLPAECILLYSPGDAVRWQKMLRDSAAETGASEDSLRIQLGLIDRMQRFCGGAVCRHKALAEYFGQPYPNAANAADEAGAAPSLNAPPCNACDVCLGELAALPDSTTVARKILSCIYRVEERFGAAHIAAVLRGQRTQKILDWRHDGLSTFGLLRDMPRHQVMSCIDQLIAQGLVEPASPPGASYTVLRLTRESVPILKGQREVTLAAPPPPAGTAVSGDRVRERPPGALRDAGEALSPESERLFEALRALRLALARERNVPPYIIFPDTVLRELARRTPRTLGEFATIKGVGHSKLSAFGPSFLEKIASHIGG